MPTQFHATTSLLKIKGDDVSTQIMHSDLNLNDAVIEGINIIPHSSMESLITHQINDYFATLTSADVEETIIQI